MNLEEEAKKIEELYNETIKKLEKLEKDRQAIISSYIRDLESKKIKAIRDSLDL